MTEANQKGESARHAIVGDANRSSDTANDSPLPTPDTALATYRYLRGGMAVIMVMLAAAVIVEKIPATCWQTSISAYYYTSAHSVFIAVLLALGALFIVYKGSSDTEDVLLTLAGVLAFIVAMAPTSRPLLLCGRSDLPPEYKVQPAIGPNVWAVIIALVVAQVLSLWQYRRTHTQQTKSPGGTLSLYLFWLLMALGLIALVFFRGWFNTNAHGTAAVLMFLAIIATVFHTAYLVGQPKYESEHRRLYLWLYRVIAVVMLVTLIAVVVLHLVLGSWNHWVIVIETALILEFTAYWVVQTIDLWKTPDRSKRLPKAVQQRLAERPTKRGLAGLKSELDKAREDPSGQQLLRLL